jgi:hypothetical protein
MALILRIEDQDNTVLYDFLADPNLIIEMETHRRFYSQGTWKESGTMIRKGTRQSIRQAVTKLENIFKLAEEWRVDLVRNQSIFFVWATDGESLKRSLLMSGTITPQTSAVFDANLELGGSTNKAAEYAFVIEHQGFENYTSTSTTGTVHAGGGKLTLPQIYGTKNGRIASAVVELPDTYDSLWMGIRPTRDASAIASFNPILQAESATTVESGDGALATSNTVRRFTFANTTEMIPRIQWQLTSMAAYQGKYHALLVAKMAMPGQSFAIRLKTSLAPIVPATDANSYNAVSVTENVYLPIPETSLPSVMTIKNYVIDLGVVRIPFMGYRQQIRDAGSVRPYLALEFQKLAGIAGTWLDIDKVILVPAEHFVHIRRWAYNFDSDIHILTHEDGTHDHMYVDRSTGYTIDAGLPSVTNWQYPREGGVLVCVCGSSLADDADAAENATVTVNTYARWDNYRENY